MVLAEAMTTESFASIYEPIDWLLAAKRGYTMTELLERTVEELLIMWKTLGDHNRQIRRALGG